MYSYAIPEDRGGVLELRVPGGLIAEAVPANYIPGAYALGLRAEMLGPGLPNFQVAENGEGIAELKAALLKHGRLALAEVLTELCIDAPDSWMGLEFKHPLYGRVTVDITSRGASAKEESYMVLDPEV